MATTPNPVLPAEFKAIVPNGSENFCDVMPKVLVQFPSLFYRWYAWAFKEDGSISDDFAAVIGSFTPTADGAPTSPLGLTATGLGTSIVLSWSASALATSYKIYRNTTNDSSTASQIGTSASPVYNDSTVSGTTTYYYWVKATNSYGDSGFSAVAYAAATGGGVAGDLIAYTGAEVSRTILAGESVVTVYVWGGGGGGGRGADYLYGPTGIPTPIYGGGGGGGGGGYAHKLAHAVTPGDALAYYVGAGGSAGNQGGESYIKLNGSMLVRVAGGYPGGHANMTNPGVGGSGGSGLGYGDGTTAGSAGSNGSNPAGGAGGAAKVDADRNPSGLYGKGGQGGKGFESMSSRATAGYQGSNGAIWLAVT